jgi:hypothetical protein
MEVLPLLDQIVQELEQDEQIIRIKKLILFVCTNKWETDQNQLESLNLSNIIQELWKQTLTLENLKTVLDTKVNKINKKTEYLLIANQILIKLGRLYDQPADNEEQPTGIFINSDIKPASTTAIVENPPVETSTLSEEIDLFDVRQKIMQRTNPLRAKILLFSSLYHNFTFSERDWSALKKQDLDGLLRNLVSGNSTSAQVQNKLTTTANALENSSEYLQAGTVILQGLSPIYQKQSMAQAVAMQTPQPNQSATVVQMPIEDDDEDDLQYSQLLEPESEASPQASKSQEQPKQPAVSTPPLEPEKPAQKQPAASLSLRDSLKQKREQEEKIKQLVSEQVNSVIQMMENTLSHLEETLESQLSNQDLEEHLSIKYQAMRNFITDVQDTSEQFMEILNRLEDSERQRRQP